MNTALLLNFGKGANYINNIVKYFTNLCPGAILVC